MDKSGRRALAANLAAITKAAGSRLGWTAARGIDTKTVERAEKNEGEKGVSLQAVDDIARSLNLWSWQLLVPGLDLKHPPRIATDQIPDPTIEQALALLRARLALAHGAESTMLGEALYLLAKTPDSDRAFQNVLTALNPTPGQDSPPKSGELLRLAHAMSPSQADTRPANPQVLGGNQAGEKWTHKGVPGGTERTDESTIYQRPASAGRKRAKK